VGVQSSRKESRPDITSPSWFSDVPVRPTFQAVVMKQHLEHTLIICSWEAFAFRLFPNRHSQSWFS
jgi:hypothetical protein